MPLTRIIDQLQAGVEAEKNFELLFRRCYRLVRHCFEQRGVARETAEDLTQETFLIVHERIGTFRREARFESWLLAIADNVYKQMRRARSAAKRAADEVSLESSGGEVPAPSHALRRLVAKEQARTLLEALDELPDQMRQCAILRLSQEMRYREIAEALDLSLDAVKVQLARARSRLRDRFAERFDGLEP